MAGTSDDPGRRGGLDSGDDPDERTHLLPLPSEAEPSANPQSPEPRSSTSTAVVLAILAVAASIGLLAGAVWGLRDRATPTAQPTPAPSLVTPSTGLPSIGPTPTPTPTTTPTTLISSPTPSGTSSGSSTPSPAASGNFPPAPSANQLSDQEWRVGNYRIRDVSGRMVIEATVRNAAATTRSAGLTIYAYVKGKPLAILTASVIQLGANATAPIVFTSTNSWKPGPKVLLLSAGG